MKVGVANATKKDLDLHVALGGIASRDCCGGHWRCLTGSRISFRFVSAWMHTRTLCNNTPASSDALDSENRDLGNLDNKFVGFPAFPAWKASPLLRIRCNLRDVFIKSFVNRRPSAATPGAAGDGNSDREAYSVFSIAPRVVERRANGRSGVSHLRCGARNNIGNTIGTSRADLRDESNLCAAIPLVVAMRSRQNNSATLAPDQAKAWRA